MVLASDDRATQRAFGGVVVERNRGIVEEARELAPSAARVLDGLVERVAGGAGALDQGTLQIGDDRARLGVAQAGTVLGRRCPLLDLVELADQVEDSLRLFGKEVCALDELATRVHHARAVLQRWEL